MLEPIDGAPDGVVVLLSHTIVAACEPELVAFTTLDAVELRGARDAINSHAAPTR